MSGVRQKAPDSLQNKRAGRYRPLQVLPASEMAIPVCPEGLSDQARETWRLIWSSRLGSALGEIDAIALGRWLSYLDQWHKARAEVAQQGSTVKGRRGGLVTHPSVRLMFRLEANMRQLEKHYGLDPLSRLRLGVSLAQAYDPVRSLKAAAAIKQYKDRLEQR